MTVHLLKQVNTWRHQINYNPLDALHTFLLTSLRNKNKKKLRKLINSGTSLSRMDWSWDEVMNIPTSLSARKTKLKKLWIQYIHCTTTCGLSEHSVKWVKRIDCAVCGGQANGDEVAGKGFYPTLLVLVVTFCPMHDLRKKNSFFPAALSTSIVGL